MSCGTFEYFGAACPASASLSLVSPSIRFNNRALAARHATRLVLQHKHNQQPQQQSQQQPAADSADGEGTAAGAAPCIAVRKLVSESLVLLEDGRVASLDDWDEWPGEEWVATAFDQLNSMRLPIVDVAIGGSAPNANCTRPSAAAGGAGGHFFLALSGDGSLFAFGANNSFGQCGVGHVRPVIEPTRVSKFAPEAASEVDSHIARAARSPVPEPVVAIAAGRAHALALTASGALYAWGRNAEGQTGLSMGDNTGRTLDARNQALHPTPRFVAGLAGVRLTAIAARAHASLALDETGGVWQWGHGLLRRQYNVPTPLEFEIQPAPRVEQLSLGDAHAVLLAQGRAFSIGCSITGALGHGADGPARLEEAREISCPDLGSTALVRVECGAYSSALVDARGRLYTCGANANGKLGHDVETVGESLHTPRLVSSLSDRFIAQVSLGAQRMLAFVPTRLTRVQPGVASLTGGTMLRLEGQGLFERGDAEAAEEQKQIVASFSYLGQSAVVAATYDAVQDVVRVSAPPLAARGGVYRREKLECAVMRLSIDGGAHWTNAMRLHVFAPPAFDNAAAGSVKLAPHSGPMHGGSALSLTAPFDLLPYEHIVVRFRVEGSVGDDGVIGEVSGSFDPAHSCVRCVTPAVRSDLVPPSLPPSPSTNKSRFAKAAAPSPPTSLLVASLDLSLDGQQFVSTPLRFCYTRVELMPRVSSEAPPSIEPSAVSIAGGPIRLAVSGVHFPQAVRVQFSVGSFQSLERAATWLPLETARAQAREERARVAHAERARRARREQAEAEAAARAAQEEEENRDPRERERLAREKAAAEKEAARTAALQAKRDALTAEKAASRSSSVSPSSSPPASRPRSSNSKSRATTPNRERPGSSEHLRPEWPVRDASNGTPTDASRAASPTAVSDAGTVNNESPLSANAAEHEADEFDEAEARVAALEAEQDRMLSRLNARDREAVGFLLVDAPPFDSFGACSVQLAVSLNGQDFAPLAEPLQVASPDPRSIEPSCGPIGGGTVVRVRGSHFYQTREIEVQLQPRAQPQPRPLSSLDDASASAKASGRAMSAASKKSVATGSAAGRKAEAVPPPQPEVPQLVAEAQSMAGAFVLSAAAGSEEDSALPSPPQPEVEFVTPRWACAGTAAVHLTFDPRSNAASVNSPLFRFYDPPLVADAFPAVLSQAGGTEVTLLGRGFVQSDCVRVRLSLVEEEVEKRASGPHRTLASSSHAGGAAGAAGPSDASDVQGSARPQSSMSSARRRLAAASAHSQLVDSSALARPAAGASLTLSAAYHCNSSLTHEEEDAMRKKARAAGAAAAAKKKDVEADIEAPTITFLSPPASAINPEWLESGAAANRALELELALNGQQFVPTGLILRFDKENKAKAKAQSSKKK